MRAEGEGLYVLQIVKGLDIGNLHGGAERFAVDLTLTLKNKGVNIQLCSFFKTGSVYENTWVQKLENNNVPFFFLTDWKGDKNIINYISGLKKLISILHTTQIDITHSHFQLGTISALLLKMYGITKRALRTVHVTQEWSNGLYGWLGKNIFSSFLFPLFLDQEIGVSKSITNTISKTLGSRLFNKKPLCIHNAIPQIYQSQILYEDSLKKPYGKKVIGIIGRISDEKGQMFLLESIRTLNVFKDAIEVWVVGDGIKRKELERYVYDNDLSEIVKFYGQTNNVQQFLAIMDLVVVPSKREGLPTIILECYKMGVPVLGTDVVGINEVLIPNYSGWLVPYGDVVEMAKMITIALNDQNSRKIYVINGKKIARQYNIDYIASQYIELYKTILIEKNQL